MALEHKKDVASYRGVNSHISSLLNALLSQQQTFSFYEVLDAGFL
jgi:hypothetical protein